MDRGAWWATVCVVTESDMAKGTEHTRLHKVHNKCNALESSLNHRPAPVCGKIVFHEIGHWLQKGCGPLIQGMLTILSFILEWADIAVFQAMAYGGKMK